MSQHDFCFVDTGLMIDDELCAYLMKAAFKKFPEEVTSAEVKTTMHLPEEDFIEKAQRGILPEEFFDVDRLCDIFEDDEDVSDLCRICNCCGEANTNTEIAQMYHIDTNQYVHFDFDYDTISAYVPLKKGPSLFSQSYMNAMEAVAELEESVALYSEFIPKNFSYSKYVCNINGVIYC